MVASQHCKINSHNIDQALIDTYILENKNQRAIPPAVVSNFEKLIFRM